MILTLEEIQKNINAFVFDRTDGVVQTGPFAGMVLLPEIAWAANSISAMLLGTFEEELSPAFEQEIARLSHLPNPRIVNVGCSEGYYAIGLARRLPKATVYAVDTSEKSIDIAIRAAAANGVRNVIFNAPIEEAFAGTDLVVMDCEGAELIYLDLALFPSLSKAAVIVELHNFPEGPRTDEEIYRRFDATHNVNQIHEGARDPNRFKFLTQYTSEIRWAAVSEHRPCLMGWFVMHPRNIPATLPTLRTCGECTLCCKLEKIAEIDKPRNVWCKDCEQGVGCKIYEQRPNACRTFTCRWLNDLSMTEEMRPDNTHLYAAGDPASGYMKVCVDPAAPNAWREGIGKEVVDLITRQGVHVVVNTEQQVNFVKAEGKDMPGKILLDWTLI